MALPECGNTILFGLYMRLKALDFALHFKIHYIRFV